MRGDTLVGMPTTRPRHQVTETPEIAAALDRAEQRWPGEQRGRLLLRLIAAGDDAESKAAEERRAARLRAIEEAAGKYTGMYPDGYLAELREDWPE